MECNNPDDRHSGIFITIPRNGSVNHAKRPKSVLRKTLVVLRTSHVVINLHIDLSNSRHHKLPNCCYGNMDCRQHINKIYTLDGTTEKSAGDQETISDIPFRQIVLSRLEEHLLQPPNAILTQRNPWNLALTIPKG